MKHTCGRLNVKAQGLNTPIATKVSYIKVLTLTTKNLSVSLEILYKFSMIC